MRRTKFCEEKREERRRARTTRGMSECKCKLREHTSTWETMRQKWEKKCRGGAMRGRLSEARKGEDEDIRHYVSYSDEPT